MLAATVVGNWIPGSALEPYFSLSRNRRFWRFAGYGFVASVLPVWLLLCPRDYLSSFLKIGTVALLVGAVIVANPKLQAPAVNDVFAGGGGPVFQRGDLPVLLHLHHVRRDLRLPRPGLLGHDAQDDLKESDIRTIGYGAMLIEGLVGVVALIAAASLPPGDYWAINIDLSKVEIFRATGPDARGHRQPAHQIEQQVGGESLRGRTGGAVTLAVGMAQIFSDATDRVALGTVNLESVIKYWYHFAIMFEALFILTTIDTGTRIARFLLQGSAGQSLSRRSTAPTGCPAP